MIDRELITRKMVLIAQESGEPPPRDHQSFVDLGRLGVLDAGFARQVASAGGLRNRLVHEYDELDPVKVHEALSTAVAEVTECLDQVRRFLDRGAG